MAAAKRFRFLLVSPYSLSERAAFQPGPRTGPKEAQLPNYAGIAHLLEDVEWELHPGAPATHGDWPVELREEFAITGVNRLPIVREACASGRYDAVVLLGGGDPGYLAAREIGHRHGVPVTSCAHAQMHIAGMLGARFSVLDISEVHNMRMADLVRLYAMTERCASIRNLDHPLPRPAAAGRPTLLGEEEKAARGEPSSMLEAAVREAVAAIEEDGAEVLILGCSAAYWLQRPLGRRLAELGWDVPVLEGYGCAIEMAKTLVNLRVDASGLAFPRDPPRRSRRRKFV
ncbi:aspartate/glutamate racemase family protein [Caldovatus aquaticus]|uniref:Aspartate/glutamate racemase family protein n=1 Tax=Caldovatus aquaticus TaxID=2865671 RepID=A0ABS7F1D9_9PROT|nr:aspartate/glutamate racemase family protein [Caldovatus aquaticus]MBW8269433.1 aspartate/glutamate racemase family protein [Caldovatus aquaticus]